MGNRLAALASRLIEVGQHALDLTADIGLATRTLGVEQSLENYLGILRLSILEQQPPKECFSLELVQDC